MLEMLVSSLHGLDAIISEPQVVLYALMSYLTDLFSLLIIHHISVCSHTGSVLCVFLVFFSLFGYLLPHPSVCGDYFSV